MLFCHPPCEEREANKNLYDIQEMEEEDPSYLFHFIVSGTRSVGLMLAKNASFLPPKQTLFRN